VCGVAFQYPKFKRRSRVPVFRARAFNAITGGITFN
jgi:hypothetical protein